MQPCGPVPRIYTVPAGMQRRGPGSPAACREMERGFAVAVDESVTLTAITTLSKGSRVDRPWRGHTC